METEDFEIEEMSDYEEALPNDSSRAMRFKDSMKDSLDDVQQRLKSVDVNWKAIISALGVIGLGVFAYKRGRGRSKRSANIAKTTGSHRAHSTRNRSHNGRGTHASSGSSRTHA